MENKKTKIIYLITKSNWGGAQKYVYDLASFFSKENEIIVVHGGHGILCKKLDKINIKRIEIKELNRDINFFDEIKIFKKLIDIFHKEKPNIIHLNSSKIGGLGSLAGRIAGIKKIIFTAHGFAFNEDRPVWQKNIIKFLTYITLILSSKTIVISKKELNQIKKWPFITNKISLIYNGVSKINFFKKKDAQEFLIEKCGLALKKTKDNFFENPQKVWVGTISELTKNKGLKYGIRAIKILKKYLGKEWSGIFIIIGEGEDRKYLKNIIKKEGLEKDIFFTGFIKDAQKYLKAFDIFLLSSTKEGLPYVLMEAGQAKNTIIATKVGGIEEIIDNQKNGILVNPKNEKEIADTLKTCIKNTKKAEKFGKKIEEKIEKIFSIDKMIEKTSEIYFK